MEKDSFLDKAKTNNCPYFILTIENSHLSTILEKDKSIESCLKEIYFSYCVFTYAQRKIIISIDDKIDNLEGRNNHINEILAQSFSKAYGIPVIMGTGYNQPAIYRNKKKLNLPISDLSYLIKLITGKDDLKNINKESCHIAWKDESFYAKRQDFMRRVKAFGIDVIPALIVATSIKEGKTAPWLEALKIKIMDPEAKAYIKRFMRNRPYYHLLAMA